VRNVTDEIGFLTSLQHFATEIICDEDAPNDNGDEEDDDEEADGPLCGTGGVAQPKRIDQVEGNFPMREDFTDFGGDK